jgi:hypothetical protein
MSEAKVTSLPSAMATFKDVSLVMSLGYHGEQIDR